MLLNFKPETLGYGTEAVIVRFVHGPPPRPHPHYATKISFLVSHMVDHTLSTIITYFGSRPDAFSTRYHNLGLTTAAIPRPWDSFPDVLTPVAIDVITHAERRTVFDISRTNRLPRPRQLGLIRRTGRVILNPGGKLLDEGTLTYINILSRCGRVPAPALHARFTLSGECEQVPSRRFNSA